MIYNFISTLFYGDIVIDKHTCMLTNTFVNTSIAICFPTVLYRGVARGGSKDSDEPPFQTLNIATYLGLTLNLIQLLNHLNTKLVQLDSICCINSVITNVVNQPCAQGI